MDGCSARENSSSLTVLVLFRTTSPEWIREEYCHCETGAPLCLRPRGRPVRRSTISWARSSIHALVEGAPIHLQGQQ
jgi:hypothetical protein